MRFTLFEPTALSPHHLLHLAREAEAGGFDSFALNDGTFQMRDTEGVYPFSADHRRNWDLEAPFYEPMTILPALAMQTERLRFFTSVLKLPLHSPLLLAKQVATAAIMSGDRFALGVGASWAPEEYRFCGVDWHQRGRRLDESIEALRLVLSGEMVEYHGKVIDFDPLVARPAPQVPVKILVGGHLEPSLRRAASLADGWIAGPAAMEELERLITRLRELLDEHSRDPARFEIHATPAGAPTLDTYRRLEELGVTDAGTLPILPDGERMDTPTRQRLRGAPVEAARDPEAIYSKEPPALKIDAVRRFSDSVIAHWRAREERN